MDAWAVRSKRYVKPLLNNLALLLIISFHSHRVATLIAVILIGISYWRLFSKKIYQQVAINAAFSFWSPIVRPFSRLNTGQAALAIPLFRCSQCHQRIRIPRHHGRVRMLPQCGHQLKLKCNHRAWMKT